MGSNDYYLKSLHKHSQTQDLVDWSQALTHKVLDFWKCENVTLLVQPLGRYGTWESHYYGACKAEHHYEVT